MALTDGLVASGSHVLDAGQIPTPVAHLAHRHWKTEAVLIVTASHNPPDYNGLKLMRGELPPTPEDFDRLRHQVEGGNFRLERGQVEKIDPVPAYKAWIMERWRHLRRSAGIVVVLDAGNGAWSELAPVIFEDLGFQVHRLFCTIDGTFPNRCPDCARPGSLMALKNEVVSTSARLGIAWDGDGDRVAFVDGSGSWASPDEVSALMIRELVPQEPGAVVVYDLKLADIVRQSALACGGRPIAERSGHAFIKRTMLEQQALFGCEVSGHYFFRELHGGDDGLFASLLMADLLRRSGRSLAELRQTLPPFYVTPDLRIPLNLLNYAEVVSRLRRVFANSPESTLDGIRWETPEGYVLARESVTEPVVTVRLEALHEDGLHQLIGLCLEALPEAGGEILRQIEEMRNA
jgi:phosphomannomutase